MIALDLARSRSDLVAWLAQLGMPAPAAEVVVDHVLAAEVVGRRSHGLRLLLWLFRSAAAHVESEVAIETSERGTLVVTAGGLPGIYAVHQAVEAVVRAHADGRGVVTVAVRGFTGSTGCLGLFAHRLAQEGSIGMVAATSPSIMAPPGTATAVLGTNAMALGAPVAGSSPLVVDFSSSAWSYGDIALARARGECLPEGVLLDRSGAPTTDPREVVDGSILPSGGHRGWSQALLVEVLAGAAVGGKVGQADGGESAFVLSLAPHAFGGSPSTALGVLVGQLLAAAPGPDAGGAHIPGARFEQLEPWPDTVEVETSTLERLVGAGGPALDR